MFRTAHCGSKKCVLFEIIEDAISVDLCDGSSVQQVIKQVGGAEIVHYHQWANRMEQCYRLLEY